jgi:di/tricarboxylate transporter
METYGGMEPFGFFDFTPMGAIVLGTGILYFLLIGHRILPDRTPGGDLSESYHLRDYLSEVRVGEKSSLIGKTLPESRLGQKYDLNIVQIQRCDEGLMVPLQDPVLMAGDLLIVQGSSQNIIKASEALGLETIQDWKFEELSQESQALVEVTLPSSITENLSAQIWLISPSILETRC